ncbi:MAG: hypothetical protein IKP36_00720 [Bacteroidaceae bacterium]|nr:hypothetical protein [Bacteroidaceae bacterium]
MKVRRGSVPVLYFCVLTFQLYAKFLQHVLGHFLEAACVGPTEDQLKEAGTPFECHKSFYRANGKALAMNETEGMVKLCCEPDEGRILSAHVFGAHAADIVQEVTAYITLGATLRQLRDTVHIHPTLSEVLIEVN